MMKGVSDDGGVRKGKRGNETLRYWGRKGGGGGERGGPDHQHHRQQV